MAVDCLIKPSGSCQVIRRRAALPPLAVAVAQTCWPKLNSTFAAPQVSPVPSNVAIEGVGVAWGINKGKVIPRLMGALNIWSGLITDCSFRPRLESKASEALDRTE